MKYYRGADDIVVQLFKRDGQKCPLTDTAFKAAGIKPILARSVRPVLAHIIPSSVHDKVSVTLPSRPFLILFPMPA
jgi:hypothetical protein